MGESLITSISSFYRKYFLILLVAAIFFAIPNVVKGQAYIALDWNIAVTMSDSDFNNGASGGSPGVAFGAELGRFSPEIFYKRLRLDQEEDIPGEGEVLTEISSDVLGLGVRVNHHPFFYSKFGLSFHFVEAEYESLTSNKEFDSTIDQTWSAPYFGGGFKYPMNPQWEFFTDIAFYLSGAEYSVFNWELGVRYMAF